MTASPNEDAPRSILGLRVEDMAPPEVIAERFRAHTVTAQEVRDALASWGQWLKGHAGPVE